MNDIGFNIIGVQYYLTIIYVNSLNKKKKNWQVDQTRRTNQTACLNTDEVIDTCGDQFGVLMW